MMKKDLKINTVYILKDETSEFWVLVLEKIMTKT